MTIHIINLPLLLLLSRKVRLVTFWPSKHLTGLTQYQVSNKKNRPTLVGPSERARPNPSTKMYASYLHTVNG
jgi:hypothetical protein